MANTRFGVKNVGSPCEIFSIASGYARHIFRTRSMNIFASAICPLHALTSGRNTYGLNRIFSIRRTNRNVVNFSEMCPCSCNCSVAEGRVLLQLLQEEAGVEVELAPATAITPAVESIRSSVILGSLAR